MLTALRLAQIRSVVMGLAGLAAVVYVTIALMADAAPPVFGWGLLAASLGAAAIIFVTTLAAPRAEADASLDELYTLRNRQAEGLAYWIAIAIYLIFGAAIGAEWITAADAIGPMAGLTGAAYLIPYAILTWQRA